MNELLKMLMDAFDDWRYDRRHGLKVIDNNPPGYMAKYRDQADYNWSMHRDVAIRLARARHRQGLQLKEIQPL